MAFTVHEIAPVRQWYSEIGTTLGERYPPIGRALFRRIWGNVVSAVRDKRHGGCFLVVSDESIERRLPLEIRYPMASDLVPTVMRARMAVEPELSRHVRGRDDMDATALDDAHFLERDVACTCDLLAALALVDGAVVLRRDLRLVGFGAEILAVTSPDEGEAVDAFVRPSHDDPTARQLSSFGMRHRSAYRFVEAVPGALAFVISQDGDLRVFHEQDGTVRLYEGPSPEDWVIAS
jgi:hypothetical protein